MVCRENGINDIQGGDTRFMLPGRRIAHLMQGRPEGVGMVGSGGEQQAD